MNIGKAMLLALAKRTETLLSEQGTELANKSFWSDQHATLGPGVVLLVC
jgi:hypothetical protein